jgi:hypothetical protein
LAPARLSCRERRGDVGGALVHEIEESVNAPRHHVAQVPVRGQLFHVGVDVDHQSPRTLAHRPMHGVSLIEAGAEDEQAIKFPAEDGSGCMAAARIAKDTERQRVIFREHALCP